MSRKNIVSEILIQKVLEEFGLAVCRTLEESTAKTAFMAHFCLNYGWISQYIPQVWTKMLSI